VALDILYFAWVRERIGLDQERIDLPADISDVAGLIAWLSTRGPGYAEALAEPARLRAAIDQKFAALDASIVGAREVAIFPPVTGG
jgi:molybdopterin synthase sulfur carrier subunit